MIPAFTSPGPTQFFRYGETCSALKHTFAPGSELAQHSWTYESAIRTAFDVTGASWQLFSKNSDDLDSMLWNGNLSWVFLNMATVVIGPLTQFTGGLADYYFPESRGNMERLAETHNGLPSEEMWRILTQGNKIGDTFIFNGSMNYKKHPVVIPPSCTCEVRLDSDTPIVFKDEMRIRIILHGIYKNVVEVG